MPPPPQNTGTLQPGVWTRVMQAWGSFTLRYSVGGTAFPITAHMYTPFPGGDFTLSIGSTFDFGPLGYGEVWFKSDTGGSYSIGAG